MLKELETKPYTDVRSHIMAILTKRCVALFVLVFFAFFFANCYTVVMAPPEEGSDYEPEEEYYEEDEYVVEAFNYYSISPVFAYPNPYYYDPFYFDPYWGFYSPYSYRSYRSRYRYNPYGYGYDPFFFGYGYGYPYSYNNYYGSSFIYGNPYYGDFNNRNTNYFYVGGTVQKKRGFSRRNTTTTTESGRIISRSTGQRDNNTALGKSAADNTSRNGTTGRSVTKSGRSNNVKKQQSTGDRNKRSVSRTQTRTKSGKSGTVVRRSNGTKRSNPKVRSSTNGRRVTRSAPPRKAPPRRTPPKKVKKKTGSGGFDAFYGTLLRRSVGRNSVISSGIDRVSRISRQLDKTMKERTVRANRYPAFNRFGTSRSQSGWSSFPGGGNSAGSGGNRQTAVRSSSGSRSTAVRTSGSSGGNRVKKKN